MKASLVILAVLCSPSFLLAQAIPLTFMPSKRCAKAKHTVNIPVSKAYKLALGFAAESGFKITDTNPLTHQFTYQEPALQEAGSLVVSRKVSVRLVALGPSCTHVSAKRFGPRLPENLSKQWQHILANSVTPAGK